MFLFNLGFLFSILLFSACSESTEVNHENDPGDNSNSIVAPLDTICPVTFNWSSFSPSADTQTIYLSSSDGNDSNDCLSAQAPCKTQSAAVAKLRDGFPDHLLIKRGDIFTGALAGGFGISGRSADEPLVIATYGDHADRPIFLTGNSSGFTNTLFKPLRHVWIMDIVFEANYRNPYLPTYNPALNQAATGISLLAMQHPVEDILIEGCEVRYFNGGFVGHNSNDVRIADIRLRGNALHTQWSITGGPNHQGHSQGMYTNGIQGLLVEGNVFDGNGGLYNYPDDPRLVIPAGLTQQNVTITWFNHQVYSDGQNSDVKICNNVFANGDGVQIRSGGTVVDNIFLRTVNALTGGGDDGMTENAGFQFYVENNLFMEGTDFPDESSTPGPRGNGLGFGNVSSGGATIKSNTFLRHISAGPYGVAISLNGRNCPAANNTSFPCPVRKATIENNQIINWANGIQLYGTPGSQLSDIIVQNNTIAISTSSDSFLTNMENTPSPAVVWNRNRYFSGNPNGRWFGIDLVPFDFTAWQALAGDADSSIGAISLANPNIKFEDVVGGAGTNYLDAFRRIHRQIRWSYDADLSARNLIERIRSGAGITP